MTTTTGDGGAGTGPTGGSGSGPNRALRLLAETLAYGIHVLIVEVAKRWPRGRR